MANGKTVFTLQGDVNTVLELNNVITYVSHDGKQTVSFTADDMPFEFNNHINTNTTDEVANLVMDAFCFALMAGLSRRDKVDMIKKLAI